MIFTLFILLLFRLGCNIPVPFIDGKTLSEFFDATLSTTILGFYNALSGSAFSQASVLALGIQPYINACPYGLKVLSNGTLTKKITVKAAAFSESAKEKIEQPGGKAEVI